jgi:hypothetical protein
MVMEEERTSIAEDSGEAQATILSSISATNLALER